MQSAKRVTLAAAFVAAVTAAAAQVSFDLAQDRLTTPATAVFLTGSFNSWSTTATPMVREGATWRVRMPLADGRHYYKFACVDQAGKMSRIKDPANPFLADDGAHGANSFVDVRGGERVAVTEGLEKFEWYAPQAKWVCVAGDFNNWYLGQLQLARQDDGRWLGYLPIKPPYAYKFIVDGLWKLDLSARAKPVPNGLGETNSYKPQAVVTEPANLKITRTIAPGDEQELGRIAAFAQEANYGNAVALARKVAQVNEAAFGSTYPMVLHALHLEGAIHRRWNRLDDAAICWERMATSRADTTETCHAIAELAAYYLFVKHDNEAGRRLNEIALIRTANRVEMVIALEHWISLNLREGRVDEAMAVVDQALRQLPVPDGKDKMYAAELCELWEAKGAIYNRLKEPDNAAKCFYKILEIHPWWDGQTPQRVRWWLERNGYKIPPKPQP